MSEEEVEAKEEHHEKSQKTAEDIKHEFKKRQETKDNALKERIKPLKTEGLGEDALDKLCEELHTRVSQLEEAKYDLEFKIRKQDLDIYDLTLETNEIRGRFVKPILRKTPRTDKNS